MQQNKRSREQFESSRQHNNDRRFSRNDNGPVRGRGAAPRDRSGRGGSRGRMRGRGRGRGAGFGRGTGRSLNRDNDSRPTKFTKGNDNTTFKVLPFFIRRKPSFIIPPSDQEYYILSAAKKYSFEIYDEKYFGKYYDKSVQSYMVCEHQLYDEYDENRKTEDQVRENVLKHVRSKFQEVLGDNAYKTLQNDNLLSQIKNIKVKVVLGDSLFTKNPPVHSENAILIQEKKEYDDSELKDILNKGNPRKFFASVGDSFANQLIRSEFTEVGPSEKQGISLIFYDRRKKFPELKDQRLKIKAKVSQTATTEGWFLLEFKNWNVHTKNFWIRIDLTKPKTIEEIRGNYKKQLSHGARLEIFYERDLTPKEMTDQEKEEFGKSLKEMVRKIEYNPTTKSFRNVPITGDFHFCTFRIKDKTTILNEALDTKCTVTKVHQYETNNTYIHNEVTFVDNFLQSKKEGTSLLNYFSDINNVQLTEGEDPSVAEKVLEERYNEVCDRAVDKLLRHVLEDCIVQTLEG